MSRVALALLTALSLLGCSPAPAPEPAAVEAPAKAAAPVPEPAVSASPELFGAPFAEQIPAVSLGALVKDPTPYNGQIIETTGKVSQVCQAAGCWMELSDADSGERVRTPMAGHAFFLPKTVVGKEARVQGRVELIALSEGMKKHIEAEGAQATSGKLSLSALSVSIH